MLTPTCKWLFTSSLVRPSTCMSSRICLGVAAAEKENFSSMSQMEFNSRIHDLKLFSENISVRNLKLFQLFIFAICRSKFLRMPKKKKNFTIKKSAFFSFSQQVQQSPIQNKQIKDLKTLKDQQKYPSPVQNLQNFLTQQFKNSKKRYQFRFNFTFILLAC